MVCIKKQNRAIMQTALLENKMTDRQSNTKLSCISIDFNISRYGQIIVLKLLEILTFCLTLFSAMSDILLSNGQFTRPYPTPSPFSMFSILS